MSLLKKLRSDGVALSKYSQAISLLLEIGVPQILRELNQAQMIYTRTDLIEYAALLHAERAGFEGCIVTLLALGDLEEIESTKPVNSYGAEIVLQELGYDASKVDKIINEEQE